MNEKIIIIGGGICGLTAARILEQHNQPFLLLDEHSRPGGRLQSDTVDGFILDHGFQIINTAYPEFHKQGINLDLLNPAYFASGARIFSAGKTMILADPVREPAYRMKSLFSGAAGLLDFYRMYKMQSDLMREIPENPDWKGISTMKYLKDRGFSNKIIRNFFQPFFSGVFLESELKTDAGFFEFMFRIFGNGNAALPAQGIQQLAALILQDINPRKVMSGVSVAFAEPGRILLADGRELNPEKVIFANGTRPVKPVNEPNLTGMRSTSVLYFTTDVDPGLGRFITLNANQGGLIHSLVQLSAVQPGYAPEGQHLLGVNLIPGVKYSEGMETNVLTELDELLGPSYSFRFLRAYYVANALPVLSRFHPEPQILKPYENAWAGGDFSAYPSLNAAMHSGRLLAHAVLGS